MSDPTTLPAFPTVPSIWSLQNILIFVAALATFVVAVIAEAGGFLPAGTTHQVAVVSGVVGQIGALATALGVIFTHNSTTAKIVAAQAQIHTANIAGGKLTFPVQS